MKQIVLSIIVLLFLSADTYAQDYIDARKLPIPDCSHGFWNKFHENKERVLVLPDHSSDSSRFSRTSSYMKGGYADSLIKKESELKNKDLEMKTVIYGIIADFNNWAKFDLPFKKIKGGFSFNGREYKNKDDGFFYLSENLVVYSGNSADPLWKLQTTDASLYRYIILEDGILSELALSDSEIVNIKRIREINYNNKKSKYYNLFIDKKLPQVSVPDSIVEDICRKLELPLPEFKLNACMHYDPNAARLFANFFYFSCDTLSLTDKFGTVHLDGIHTTGNGIGLIRHESFHLLWDKIVCPGNPNPFFLEGIQKYYEFINDTANFHNSLKTVQKHLDYDITELITYGNTFWNTPSENGRTIAYDIAGLFVKYLIDSRGLDSFKRFSAQKNLKEAFAGIYGAEDLRIAGKYKEWVKEEVKGLP